MATKKPVPAKKASFVGAVKQKQAPKPAESKAAKGGASDQPWFQQPGWGAAKNSVARSDKQISDMRNTPRRYWMKNGTDEKIIFIDDSPQNFREHEFAIGGDWKNRAHKTCLTKTGDQDAKNCPYCAADNRGYFASALTVIHLCSYKSRDGKEVKNPLRLFVAKTQAVKILGKHAEKLGNDLSGCVFEVSRTGDKSPSVGDLFTFVERVKLNDLKVLKRLGFEKAPKPYNYDEVFASTSKQEASEWLSNTSVESSGGGSASTDNDDDVPF